MANTILALLEQAVQALPTKLWQGRPRGSSRHELLRLFFLHSEERAEPNSEGDPEEVQLKAHLLWILLSAMFEILPEQKGEKPKKNEKIQYDWVAMGQWLHESDQVEELTHAVLCFPVEDAAKLLMLSELYRGRAQSRMRALLREYKDHGASPAEDRDLAEAHYLLVQRAWEAVRPRSVKPRG